MTGTGIPINSNNSFSTPQSASAPNPTDPQAFPARLLALSTLQILANSTQFTSIRPTSHVTLTHVASRYLQLLAEAARAHADHSGRTHINAWDLSGVFEFLQGPGALSGLHNWCIDNCQALVSPPPADPFPDLNALPDERLKLFALAKQIPLRPATDPRLEPIASLSFLPLSPAQLAALDRPADSDSEKAFSTPPPSSTSASSDQDSDDHFHLPKPNTPLSPVSCPPEIPSLVGPSSTDRSICEALVERWRSVDEIPSFVPPYFPPLPGLERIPPSATDDPEVSPLPVELIPEPEPEPEPDISLIEESPPNLDPYLTATPYTKSQLFEQHGSSALPQLPSPPPVSVSPTSPPEPQSDSPPPRKKVKQTDPLECFKETYAFYLQEGRTPDTVLKPNARRLELISKLPTEPLGDSIFGSIAVNSIRPNRWSAGWIPHPPTARVGADELEPVPELKPFGHAPLPVPLTMPVPTDLPPNPLAPPAHQRIPSLLPSLFRALPDSFTLINRLTRLGPPCELGQAGEPTAYRIKESAATESSTGGPSRPKYMEWGFAWPSHHGHEPLPAKREPSSFVVADFPAMPKTTAEKARLAQLEREAADKARPAPPQIQIIDMSEIGS